MRSEFSDSPSLTYTDNIHIKFTKQSTFMSCPCLFPFQLCVHNRLVVTKLQFPYQLNYGTDITVFNSSFLASIILRTSLIKNYGGFNIEFRHSLGFECSAFIFT